MIQASGAGNSEACHNPDIMKSAGSLAGGYSNPSVERNATASTTNTKKTPPGSSWPYPPDNGYAERLAWEGHVWFREGAVAVGIRCSVGPCRLEMDVPSRSGPDDLAWHRRAALRDRSARAGALAQ